MMQESAQDARKGVNLQQRIEIVIPVSAIRRKLPEIGQQETDKMRFALVLRSGKKLNVKKLEFDQSHKISQVTKERMRKHEEEALKEK